MDFLKKFYWMKIGINSVQHKIRPFLVVLILSGNYGITRPGFNVLDDKNQ